MKKLLLPMLTAIVFATNLNAQIITTFAGNGIHGYCGDNGAATSACLNDSFGGQITVDAAGNIFIADADNNRIRKVNTSGVISTIAGNGIGGYSGDGGPATSASLSTPIGVAVDGLGNIYIADFVNNRIRKVDTSGVISTIAGNGDLGYSGDGGPATSASLRNPIGIAVDALGNIYIADHANVRIRKVDTNGVISTIAGNGNWSYSGDGGAATNASLWNPTGVTVDALGNIFIADGNIRKVDTSGVISTVAGNSNYGYSGDGGAATSASLDAEGVILDAFGNIFIADAGNNRIRKVDTSGVISTIAGNGTQGFSGDGGAATSASLNNPTGIAVDAKGNIYLADNGNSRVRKVYYGTLPIKFSYFTAIANNNNIQTTWRTSTEPNTSHFIIQHSIDGNSFIDIGTVKAIGSGANGYSFTDTHPTNGINYYRLKSVDKDGASTFSKVVNAEIVDSRYEIVVVPNPVRSLATIKGNHIASVQVIDNIGRVVKTVILKDATNPTLAVVGLQAGVYHLRVETSDGKVSGANLMVNDK